MRSTARRTESRGCPPGARPSLAGHVTVQLVNLAAWEQRSALVTAVTSSDT